VWQSFEKVSSMVAENIG